MCLDTYGHVMRELAGAERSSAEQQIALACKALDADGDQLSVLRTGKLGFQLAELSALPVAAIVVEERDAAPAASPRVTPGWPCELVAQLQVRYPSVPIVFADSRYLAAAAALHGDADR